MSIAARLLAQVQQIRDEWPVLAWLAGGLVVGAGAAWRLIVGLMHSGRIRVHDPECERRLTEAHLEIDALREQVSELRQQVSRFTERLSWLEGRGDNHPVVRP